MPRLILLDQLRLSVLARRNLAEPQARKLARLVHSARFRRKLLRALRAAFRQHPVLARARVQLSG
jgi:hypothetical protein